MTKSFGVGGGSLGHFSLIDHVDRLGFSFQTPGTLVEPYL